MVSGLFVVFLGIATLYIATTFVMIQDIRDNTERMVALLEDRPNGSTDEPASGDETGASA